MVNIGPKIIINGDRTRGDPLIGFGLQLLLKVKNLASFRKLKQFSLEYPTAGGLVKASSFFGVDTIEITPFVPEIIEEPRVIEEVVHDYLIGWYKNDEGSGSIVHNYATDGVLGGGLLPNLDIVNPSEYWIDSGFAHSPWMGDDIEALTYAHKSFSQRTISADACFGMFVKRSDYWNDLGNDGFAFDFENLPDEGQYIYILLGNENNNFYLVMQWDESDGFAPTVQDEWYFIFRDDTDFLKVVLPNGSLYTSPNEHPLGIQSKMIELVLGASHWEGMYRTGLGGSFGDTIIYNNKAIPISIPGYGYNPWTWWYDQLRSRYGMAARNGW